jgi:penicillin-binding protein 1B
MVETGQIAEGEAEAALKLPIRLAPPQLTANKAPFFTDYVKAELVRQIKDKMSETEITQAGFRVYTTLDPLMNAEAQKAVSQGIAQLESRLSLSPDERLEGALASVEHSTGFIRALIGGRSYSQSTFNRILNMKRQVGSTFKPIVYLSAFLKGEDPQGIPYGPAHPAEDAPWTLVFDRGRQNWSPRNYDKENQGWISYRKALSHSINIIAAKLGFEVGIPALIQTARTLGIESELPAVPSLSLGVSEHSPIELLRVYATLANRGTQDELTVIRGITHTDGTNYARFVYHPKQVIDPGPIDLLTDILQNVFTEGTARAAQKLGFNYPAAGKTGTTSNYRDAWFAGYTPQLTTVVWVGMDQTNSKSPSRPNLTGASSALPVWVSFMKNVLKGEPVTPFPSSPFLTEVSIDRHSGKLADSSCPATQVIQEKYMKGHEPKDSGCELNWPQATPSTVQQ